MIRKELRQWKVRDGIVEKEVQVVVTPRVREEVRKHYGCDKLTGAELEDQGEEGTAMTHWEKRLFEVSLVKNYYSTWTENLTLFMKLLLSTGISFLKTIVSY